VSSCSLYIDAQKRECSFRHRTAPDLVLAVEQKHCRHQVINIAIEMLLCSPLELSQQALLDTRHCGHSSQNPESSRYTGTPKEALHMLPHSASSRIQTQTDRLAICPPNNWYHQVPVFVGAAQRKPDRDPAKNLAIHFPATTKNEQRESHQPPSFLINTCEIQVDFLIYSHEKPSLVLYHNNILS